MFLSLFIVILYICPHHTMPFWYDPLIVHYHRMYDMIHIILLVISHDPPLVVQYLVSNLWSHIVHCHMMICDPLIVHYHMIWSSRCSLSYSMILSLFIITRSTYTCIFHDPFIGPCNILWSSQCSISYDMILSLLISPMILLSFTTITHYGPLIVQCRVIWCSHRRSNVVSPPTQPHRTRK